MKLVFAIVHDEDGPKVMDELNRNGFSVTKLCSTGGFLKAGNTTLLVGVDEENLDAVIEVIRKIQKQKASYQLQYDSQRNGRHVHPLPGGSRCRGCDHIRSGRGPF